MEALGDGSAIVLRFSSSDLHHRWREFRAAGASWDFPGYKPHVSITYDGAGMDLSKIKPFDGELRFGPEVFAEINPNAMEDVRASEKQGF